MVTKKDRLDQLLENRRFEAHAPDFASRIIQAAARTEQKIPLRFSTWLKQIFAEFELPRPAFALSCALVLGLAIGISDTLSLSTDQEAPLTTLLYDSEIAL